MSDLIDANILIVEDNPINRKLLNQGIQRFTRNVDSATNAQSALTMCQNNYYDMLLFDIHLPMMSGIELATKIKGTEKYKETPIIFITGSQDQSEMNQCYDAGGVDFVTKPYSMAEVKRRISLHYEMYVNRIKLKEFSKEMETKVNIQSEQLVSADRLVTLGTLSASISHEINNPLAFISANIQIIEKYWDFLIPIIAKHDENNAEDKNSDRLKYIIEELPKSFEGMRKGVTRLSSIASQLKSFVHKSNDKNKILKKVMVNSMIQEALSLFKPHLLNKDSLKVKLHDEEIELLANAQEIEQVILNLLINAMHATESKADSEIILFCEISDNTFSIIIQDNGTGVPDENIDSLFEPFFTTKEKGKGTGLGLSIAKQIIEKHEGSLNFKNTSIGAEFTINLPLRMENK
ncbi:MAG: hypothetical protein COA79_00800 [Planctomycetota bacterium]|nr:MAG: hypothetical protein COA79_00800 [Planctomycetota bacterium]